MDIKRINRLNNSIMSEDEFNNKNNNMSEGIETTDSLVFSIYEKLKKASMQKEIILTENNINNKETISEFSQRELEVIDHILSQKSSKSIEDIPDERIKKLFEDREKQG